MNHAVAKLLAQGTARVLALQSAGTVFCAGGNPFASSGAGSLAAFVQGLRATFEGYVGLATLQVPVVCAVHGAMVGGAAAIFLQTDVRVADRSATFQHGNLSRGVCPIAGYSRSLVEAVGSEAAFQYYLTDRTITAAQALASGLVQATRTGVNVRLRYAPSASGVCGARCHGRRCSSDLLAS